MAIRWLNNYHRGFSRLWLVFSCLLTFAVVGFNWLLGGYKVYLDNNPYRKVKSYDYGYGYRSFYNSAEYKIKQRVQERWREWFVNDKSRTQLPETSSAADKFLAELTGEEPHQMETRIRILNDVRSMAEAKSFTDKELNAVVKNAIKYEKGYQAALKAFPLRKWMARGRAVRDLLGAFIVTFGFGHGVFLVVYWIIRGFRKD